MKCEKCGGKGDISKDKQNYLEECPSCNGSGNVEAAGLSFKLAIELWGIESQLGMLQEECGEAITAVNKLRRVSFGQPLRMTTMPSEAIDFLMQEVADVMLVCEQIKVCYPKEFKLAYEEKYNRFVAMISKANNKEAVK